MSLSLSLLPRACLSIPFLFFLSNAISFPPSRPSRSSLSPALRTYVPSSPARSRTPLNWIFPISLTSYCTRCHSTYGCQRSREDSSPLTSLDSGNLAFALFFRIRRIFATRVESGFLSDPYSHSRSPSHASIGPGRPPGFFHRDNVPGYFRVYLPSPRPLFYRRIFSYHRVSPRDITYSRIISHVISRISPSDALSLPSPTVSSPLYVRSLFALYPVQLPVRSIYMVFTFSRGSSSLRHGSGLVSATTSSP